MSLPVRLAPIDPYHPAVFEGGFSKMSLREFDQAQVTVNKAAIFESTISKCDIIHIAGLKITSSKRRPANNF
jgi:hypothetical protein